MKISNINMINNISFASRREDVRRADDIQRRAKAAFPMMSSTYIDDNYKVANSSKLPVKLRAAKARWHLLYEIEKGRMKLDDPYFSIKMSEGAWRGTPYVADLNYALKTKKGNCYENSLAAMAALVANGYYNSERVELYQSISFINKETREVERTVNMGLDHTFVVTDMNKGGEKDIVVDPWISFADTRDGAVARFKQVYDKDDYKLQLNFHKVLFIAKMLLKYGKFNAEDYEIRSKMVMLPCKCDTPKAMDLFNLADYARRNYEHIMLPENE